MPEANATVRWFGKQYTIAIRAMIAGRLDAIGQHLVAAVKKNLSTPYPPASRPDNFPHMRSGDLREKISYVIDIESLSVMLVAKARHAGFLEAGTRKMKRRPFALKTVSQERVNIRKIIFGDSVGNPYRSDNGRFAAGSGES